MGCNRRLLRDAWTVLGSFVGLLIGHHLAMRQFREQRRGERITRQLAELYSPLLGLNDRALALVELRTAIGQSGQRGWQEGMKRTGATMDFEEKRFGPFSRIIDYNNRQLREEIMPLYAEMIAVFTNGYWLAEESTRQHFGELVTFHERWHRQLTDPLPSEVLEQLPALDLSALQKDLRHQISSLRARLP